MSLITAVLNDVVENYIKRSAKEAHHLAFRSRISPEIQEKLTAEEINEICDISFEIFKLLAENIKNQVMGLMGINL